MQATLRLGGTVAPKKSKGRGQAGQLVTTGTCAGIWNATLGEGCVSFAQ
jgi:hypothetical protein